MYARFRTMPLLGQLVALIVLLIAVSLALQIVVNILKALIPLTFTALVILGLLYIFDKVRD